jgi:hypothetical protein
MKKSEFAQRIGWVLGELSRACSGQRKRSALAALLLAVSSLACVAQTSPGPQKVSNQQQATECLVRDRRVCHVLDLVKKDSAVRGIVWREGTTSTQTILAEYEWALGEADVIHLGHTLDLSDAELMFLIAHEIGHSALRHGRSTVEFFAGSDRDLPDEELVARYARDAIEGLHKASSLRHQQEFAADLFAASIMLKQGHDPLAAMKSLLKGSFSSALHPSKRSRIERVSVFASLHRSTLSDLVSTRQTAQRP